MNYKRCCRITDLKCIDTSVLRLVKHEHCERFVDIAILLLDVKIDALQKLCRVRILYPLYNIKLCVALWL